MSKESEPVIPNDAKVMAAILHSMGVEQLEARVPNQFLEFAHRYVSEVLHDAQIYSEHADKKELDIDDIKLAIQAKVNSSFTQPPPREFLIGLAEKRNRQPLPMIPNRVAVHLPQDRHCLTAVNYQVTTQSQANGGTSSANGPTAATAKPDGSSTPSASGVKGTSNKKVAEKQIPVKLTSSTGQLAAGATEEQMSSGGVMSSPAMMSPSPTSQTQ